MTTGTASFGKRWGKLLGAPVGLAAGLVTALLANAGALDRMEALTLDARFALRGPQVVNPRVVVVDVDDETLNLLGWPMPRGFYAQLIDTATEHGAKGIAFDVLFLEESASPENDALLVKAASKCRCAFFPSQLSPTDDGSMRVEAPFKALAAASIGPTHVQLQNDVDGVYRAVPLSLAAGGHAYAALALALARQGGAADPTQDVAWINWRSARQSDVRALSLLQVLAADEAVRRGEKPDVDLSAIFHDALVVVGQSAKSVGDRGAVPQSKDAPLVLAHANLVDNILATSVLSPPSPGFVWSLTILLAMIVGACVSAFAVGRGVFFSLVPVGGLWFLGAAGIQGAVWAPLAAPTLGAALAFVATTIVNVKVRDAEERKIRQAFARYVAPHILDKILMNADGIDIRGHKRTLTLLFSDIKGYTTLSNTLAPDEIVELLCTYLDAMVEILLAHDGTVDKIMGDGIMAFFGDPLPQEDHALRAVKAALAMQKRVEELGRKWTDRGLSPLQVRIGIATGEVFVGSIGSRQHLEYTAIGRSVNLASRLEGKAPAGGVLISNETYALVKDHVVARAARGLDLKGYAAGYDAWHVTSMAGEGNASVPTEQRVGLRTAFFSDVTLQFQGVDLQARSSDISPGGMFIHCDVLPPRGAPVRVKASLHPHASEPLWVSMAAIVSHVREGKPGASGVGVMFTTVFADDPKAIHALLDGVIGAEAFEESRLVQGPAPAKFSYTLDPQMGPIGDV